MCFEEGAMEHSLKFSWKRIFLDVPITLTYELLWMIDGRRLTSELKWHY